MLGLYGSAHGSDLPQRHSGADQHQAERGHDPQPQARERELSPTRRRERARSRSGGGVAA